MQITSFSFLALLCVGVGIYYIFPKSCQWVELLILSLIFYCFAATPYTLVFILISTGTAWIATNFSFVEVENNRVKKRMAGIPVGAAIFLNILLWFVLKGSGFWIPLVHSLEKFLPAFGGLEEMPLVAALGMGYYTFQVVGYILDCYWGVAKPQRNIAKLLLFLLFFPQLITGPISRYNDLQSLYKRHDVDYIKITQGAQRILWGVMKKLVLAERLAVLVDKIWGDIDIYSGYYCWIAMLLYPLQIYADFSGCMDIVIGAAEIFDIRLKENFRTPFFSRTVQEFWQRWHITLGTWAKDYLLYPLLKSELMVDFGKRVRECFGKRVGKFIPTAVGMFVLWMAIGVWHGDIRYLVGVSLWYWAVLMIGKICTPWLEKISGVLCLKRTCFSWHLFQSIRTYMIFAIGSVFFRAPSLAMGISFFKELAQVFQKDTNIWILFDGSIFEIVGGRFGFIILGFSIILLVIAEGLGEKYGSARKWTAEQGIVFRWGIWFGLLFFVWLFGAFSTENPISGFIYARF